MNEIKYELNKWYESHTGRKFRFFKKGCIEVCEKGKDKPYLMIVLGSLIDEYCNIYEAFDGDVDALLEESERIKDDFNIGECS